MFYQILNSFARVQIIVTLLLIALQDNTSNAANSLNQKIHGENIDIFSAPFIVQLVTTKKEFLCSGTIFTEWHVVTAASCILNGKTGLKDLRIIANSTLANAADTLEIEKGYLHPKYTGELHNKDAAVLKLKNKLHFGNGIQKVKGICEHSLENGKNIEIYGWSVSGHDKSDEPHLQIISTTALNYNNCPNKALDIVTPNTVCAVVDSESEEFKQFTGGPVTHNGQLCGIGSRKFGVYTDIEKVEHLIDEACSDEPELDYLM